MANVVIPMDKYFDSRNVISVQAASDTLDDGYVVQAKTLVTDEIDVYQATQVTAITADELALVVGYEFYEDSLGNRPNVTDPTQITYAAGTPVTAYRLVKNARFFISDDAIGTGTPAVGQFLIPDANEYELEAVATVGGTEKYVLTVEKINHKGTYRGLNAVNGVIARVTLGD